MYFASACHFTLGQTRIWPMFWNCTVRLTKVMSIPVKKHSQALTKRPQSLLSSLSLARSFMLLILLFPFLPNIACLCEDKRGSHDVLRGVQNKVAWSLTKAQPRRIIENGAALARSQSALLFVSMKIVPVPKGRAPKRVSKSITRESRNHLGVGTLDFPASLVEQPHFILYHY